MNNKLFDLVECSSAAGLKINVSKTTKSMVINTERARSFAVGGEEVEKVAIWPLDRHFRTDQEYQRGFRKSLKYCDAQTKSTCALSYGSLSRT